MSPCLSASPPPAPADDASPAASLAARAERLSAWIVARTGYPSVAPPPLRVVAAVELKARCFPAFPPHLVPRVMAAYDAAEGVVYLSEELDLSRPLARSYLLHELVHHAQNAYRPLTETRCKGKFEGEALRLQRQWLEEQGVADPLGAMGIDVPTLRILESCP